jgi:hypothetical protein
MSDPTLSRRAVACPGWRWLAGMRTACGLRVYAIDPRWPLGIREGDQRARPECTALPDDAVPDLDDAATRGLTRELLAGLTEAWTIDPMWIDEAGEPYQTSGDGSRVLVWINRLEYRRAPSQAIRHPTEAAALVAALEAP